MVKGRAIDIKKDRPKIVALTYPIKMIVKEYQTLLKNELHHATYLLVLLLVSSLQLLKIAKLEVLAESLPIPIQFDSRRRKLRRLLRLPNFTIEDLW
ncbi:MAG: IS4 family transposase, partial [Cyanobacteria bacterium P01_F01_bin.150]